MQPLGALVLNCTLKRSPVPSNAYAAERLDGMANRPPAAMNLLAGRGRYGSTRCPCRIRGS